MSQLISPKPNCNVDVLVSICIPNAGAEGARANNRIDHLFPKLPEAASGARIAKMTSMFLSEFFGGGSSFVVAFYQLFERLLLSWCQLAFRTHLNAFERAKKLFGIVAFSN